MPRDSFVIETHDLTKAYKGVQALRSLDLKVQKHSIFGFLGRTALVRGPARPYSPHLWHRPRLRSGHRTRQRRHSAENWLSSSGSALLRRSERP